MILSLGLIGLMAGVIYLFLPHDDSRSRHQAGRLPRRAPHRAPRGLLPGGGARGSARQRGRPPPSASTATHFDPWHLGFQDPEGSVRGRSSSPLSAAAVHRRGQPGRGDHKATQQIDGRTWPRYTGGRYDALVLEDKGATTVVAGHGLLRPAGQDGEGARAVVAAAAAAAAVVAAPARRERQARDGRDGEGGTGKTYGRRTARGNTAAPRARSRSRRYDDDDDDAHC